MNYYVLAVFAPLLLIVGILGFVIPERKSLTSGAPTYNVFHITFGLIGLAILFSNQASWIKFFNVAFGAIDLYQAAASLLGLFPIKHFKWKRADDVLHIAIGAFLVIVGVFF